MSSQDVTTTAEPTDMGADQLRLFRLLLPQMPMLAKVVLLHVLRMSKQSRYVNLRTELIIAILRSLLTPSRPTSVTSVQKLSTRDPGIKGRIWVSKYTSPAPPDSCVRDAVARAINTLRDATPSSKMAYTLPELVPVQAEWTGYRAGVAKDAPLPDIPEAEKYAALMKECTSPATVLYFHGGAYWLLDPATHRPTTKRLAQLTGGRCFSVRYRLAPRNPFPAALVDALVAYLTLLYPPPGAFHKPVEPQQIVFAGDSAGGNLCLVLLQTLLELRRQDVKVAWHGRERELLLPAGVSVSSPWMDMTHSLPSCSANAAFDYLPPPEVQAQTQHLPCPIWPADPPRANLYVADALLVHPLVTPLLAPAGSWRGAPPLYLCTGWELLSDEDKYTAARMRADGVPVVFEEYEAMPHCFALVFPELSGSHRCFRAWADFITATTTTGAVESRFTLVRARSLEEVPLDPASLTPYTEDEIRERVGRRIAMQVGGATVDAAAEGPRL